MPTLEKWKFIDFFLRSLSAFVIKEPFFRNAMAKQAEISKSDLNVKLIVLVIG